MSHSFSASVLIVGSGGREHCLAWKLSQSSLLSPSATIYLATGNGGTALPTKPSATSGPGVAMVNAPLASSFRTAGEFCSLVEFCREHLIGLVVVGPEEPLAGGIADALHEAGIACFGPTKRAAQLESSKAYSKAFMERHHIPTASYRSFTDLDAALHYLHSLPGDTKLVVKASGLAAGKGVLMCADIKEAITATESMLGPAAVFGEAGSCVVVEECLIGAETSVMAFCDGKVARIMPIAQDHKRRYEFDRGLNTGGMGAISPSSLVTKAISAEIMSSVIQPAIDGCIQDGHPFVGVLFAGVMLTAQGVRVLEFNVRFGDPETQAVLPLLDTDLLVILLACVEGKLQQVMMEWKPNIYSACIVAVSEGYPEVVKKGRVIAGLDSVHYTENNPALLFHAGTQFVKENNSMITNGGRVLAITALGSTLQQALDTAYSNLEKISFEGMGYRRDIGHSWHVGSNAATLNLAVLGSTRGTVLSPILAAIESGRLNARVCCIISNRADAGILEKAAMAHIPAFTVSAKNKNRVEFDRECARILRQFDVGLVLLIGFMRILSNLLIDEYYNRILNVHPSLLPEFAGGMDLNVHESVLKAGRRESGCTVHLLDDGPVDGGPILVQKRCAVLSSDDAHSLKVSVQALEGEAYIEALQMFSRDQYLLRSLSSGEKLETSLITFYRRFDMSISQSKQVLHRVNLSLRHLQPDGCLDSVDSEYAFYIEFEPGVSWSSIGAEKRATLRWLLSETFEPDRLSRQSFLTGTHFSNINSNFDADKRIVIEVGPRLSFTSPFSANATSVCKSIGIPVHRLERFRRYSCKSASFLSARAWTCIAQALHDRMTEQVLLQPLTSFHSSLPPQPWYTVPLKDGGLTVLSRLSTELGLGLDSWDQQFIYELFVEKLRRDPTSVELFDISQSNSEHSRHWFFRGQMCIDDELQSQSLFDLVRDTLKPQAHNSVIAFSDNSSAIRGFSTSVIEPSAAATASSYVIRSKLRHLLLTAETHNFPSGVAPFPGAETGTGGRIRDTAATGRGSLVCAGISAYCVGQLHLEDYPLPWEQENSWSYPSNLASSQKIAIDASNGASDYGNKFGEPVVAGFARSFGMRDTLNQRREWIKPIMFSAGLGWIDDIHTKKSTPSTGMLIVKIGGPAYRIGMGGSAASSMMQGENNEQLDYNAVQRGDAEMEQKVNRVIRCCVELGSANPIVSIHDQGAGGNCNVLKEIVDPAGGRINIRSITTGDDTLSVLEIWGAEYQENWAVLIKEESKPLFDNICRRERAPVDYVGVVTGDGVITVVDSHDNSVPVQLDLKTVLGEIPRKSFVSSRQPFVSSSFHLPVGETICLALERTLRLMSVSSKRWLTNKVDRSVTGLVAQQQCVGALMLPLADCAVLALSYYDIRGVATAVGEQPIKGLLSPACMARLAVGEALTNIVFADISALNDIKCSANWMWAAKMENEGAGVWDAAVALRQVMLETGVSIDGGKDSLSMAARTTAEGEIVKAPPELVVTLYAPCMDVTRTLTPDIKAPGRSKLLLIDFSGRDMRRAPRLGGSALTTVYNALGDVSPDLDDAAHFVRCWKAVQDLLRQQLVCSGHDISDGGLIVAILEMAFAGNCGLSLSLEDNVGTAVEIFFGEELGVVLEIVDIHMNQVLDLLKSQGINFFLLGATVLTPEIRILLRDQLVLDDSVKRLRDVWEATSFALERLQTNLGCVESEENSLKERDGLSYNLTFKVVDTDQSLLDIQQRLKPKIAIIREEGSHGDREMAAAFFMAGFDVWDVSMTDILNGRIHLNAGSFDDGRPFRGIAFVGGFSYGDVLDSAKGWAASILKSDLLWTQFSTFYERPDTFSLGVCNGCQLMALLGWVPSDTAAVNHDNPPARFIHNTSGRYESRWTCVKVEESNSIFLTGMEGSVLGIWLSHGEGRVHFPSSQLTLEEVLTQKLAPIRYVDDHNQPTTTYPFNPNGSPAGIAALISTNGRHLAVMPHPDRSWLSWECPWMPHVYDQRPQAQHWHSQYRETARHASPWLKLFQNAYKWCIDQPSDIHMGHGANVEQKLYEREIRDRMSTVLNDTSLSFGIKKVGKVRDTYLVDLNSLMNEDKDISNLDFPIFVDDLTESKVLVLIATDRLSAFDRLIACIPLKGQVLNSVSRWWFDKTRAIVENHVISTPHPNVTIGRLCTPFPIEFVVRAYLTGSTGTSLWTHYNQGARTYCGHVLKEGMLKNQKLDAFILTPTTKSDEHDRPISAEEIVSGKWMSAEHWQDAAAKALALFELGQKVASEQGLILVDTKYEFGLSSDGRVILIDEIHTPDSSRYWIAASYQKRFDEGLEPEMVDKEFLRIWYTQHCDPYTDEALPVAPISLVTELSRRYILLYEMITGGRFEFASKNSLQESSNKTIEHVTMTTLLQLKRTLTNT